MGPNSAIEESAEIISQAVNPAKSHKMAFHKNTVENCYAHQLRDASSTANTLSQVISDCRNGKDHQYVVDRLLLC